MSSPGTDADESDYHRSVRNMLVVLGVVVVVIVASLAFSTYFAVSQNTFVTRTSVGSTYPFTLYLAVNTTSGTANGGIAIMAWLKATGTANVTASSSWPVDHSRLWRPMCQQFWPIAIGIMQGHYTTDNYSLGDLLVLRVPPGPCPVIGPFPWFYFASQSSKVLVTSDGTPLLWAINSTVLFTPALIQDASVSPGIYTMLAADEWGDLVMTNVRIF